MKRLFKYALKILVLACILSLAFILFGCNSEPQDGFAIILADTGEVLLTEEDIGVYIDEDAIFSASSAFRLNESGRQKWNSHLTYQDIRVEDYWTRQSGRNWSVSSMNANL